MKSKINKSADSRFGRIGIGWQGRPYRNPKYSIFSYLSQFPEAIITSITSGAKYYIVHTELFNNDIDPLALYKTSAKNLYYILALNYNTNQYDRCYSINMDNNQHNKRLIMTRIRNEEESYWEIEPFENDSSKIRLKSKKTGRYFLHKRKDNARRTEGVGDVYEKQAQPCRNEAT